MARPKTEQSKQRAEWFGFRLTLAERETINSTAAKVGLSPSEYVRMCALKKTVRVVPDERKPDPALLRALLAIGNNLNQIARKFNTTDRVPANFESVMALFDAFMRDQFGEKEPPP